MNKFNGIIIDTAIDEKLNKVILRLELEDTNENRCLHLGEIELKQKLFVEDYKI